MLSTPLLFGRLAVRGVGQIIGSTPLDVGQDLSVLDPLRRAAGEWHRGDTSTAHLLPLELRDGGKGGDKALRNQQ